MRKVRRFNCTLSAFVESVRKGSPHLGTGKGWMCKCTRIYSYKGTELHLWNVFIFIKIYLCSNILNMLISYPHVHTCKDIYSVTYTYWYVLGYAISECYVFTEACLPSPCQKMPDSCFPCHPWSEGVTMKKRFCQSDRRTRVLHQDLVI